MSEDRYRGAKQGDMVIPPFSCCPWNVGFSHAQIDNPRLVGTAITGESHHEH
jgi:hypothetical protein